MIFHEIESTHLFIIVKKLREQYVVEKLPNIAASEDNFSLYHPMLSLSQEFFNKDLYSQFEISSDVIVADSDSYLNKLKLVLCSDCITAKITKLMLPGTFVDNIEIDQERITDFSTKTRRSLELLKRYAPKYFRRFQLQIKEIIPYGLLPGNSRISKRGRGLSSPYYWGGIFLDPPHLDDSIENEVEFLMDIVHEAGHQALYALQSTDAIVIDPTQNVYSPIRKMDRPILKTVHAIAAISEMTLLSEELLQNNLWDERAKAIIWRHCKQLKLDLIVGLNSLKDKELTDVGRLSCQYWYAMAARPI